MTWGASTAHRFLQLPNETLWNYNAWDCHTTAHLHGALRGQLRTVGNLEYYDRWARPLMRSVVAMQRRGVLVDRNARDDYRELVHGELDLVTEGIVKHAADTGFDLANPNSEHQLRRFLFGHCELRPAGKTPTGLAKVDQAALLSVLRKLRVKDEPHRECLLNILHRTRLQTIWERYLTFDIGSDGRLRPLVKMTGTKTYRYAYAEPALQQFPGEVRHMFVAAPGHVLVAIDRSQVEARILAILSNDQISLDVFASGGDVHWQNALDMMGHERVGSLEGTQRKAARNVSKGFLYRISYGGEGATDKTKFVCPCARCVDKVPPMLELTKAEILAAEQRWFTIHSAVRRWQSSHLDSVKRTKRYRSPFGVTRHLSAPWGNDLEREVKNLPMQMNAALLMNQDQVLLSDAPILFQMHDAFVFETRDDAGLTGRIQAWKAIMERPIPELGNMVFPVDVQQGLNWGDASDDNPTGLRTVTV